MIIKKVLKGAYMTKLSLRHSKWPIRLAFTVRTETRWGLMGGLIVTCSMYSPLNFHYFIDKKEIVKSPMYITGPCGNIFDEVESASSGITSSERRVTCWMKPLSSLQTAAIGESNWWLQSTISACLEPREPIAATRPLGMDTRRLQPTNTSSSWTEQWPLSLSFERASKKLTSCCPTEKFHLKKKQNNNTKLSLMSLQLNNK